MSKQFCDFCDYWHVELCSCVKHVKRWQESYGWRNKKFWRSGSFWGDSKMVPFIVYQRKSYMKCIYCGAEADTREHCPSKAFLELPLPTNLIVLPACNRCNNGFSSDELYVKHILIVLKAVAALFGCGYGFFDFSLEKKIRKQ